MASNLVAMASNHVLESCPTALQDSIEPSGAKGEKRRFEARAMNHRVHRSMTTALTTALLCWKRSPLTQLLLLSCWKGAKPNRTGVTGLVTYAKVVLHLTFWMG